MIKACYISNTGKVRSNNEDCLLLNDLLLSGAEMTDAECLESGGTKSVYCVADGMGGHLKGELASRTVLEVIRTSYTRAETAEDIRDVLSSAKKELDNIARADRESHGLGSTVSGMMLIKDRAIVFNCGDSRVYSTGGESLRKLTRDHSVVQELVDAGIISEDDMRTHPKKNIITSSLMGDLNERLPEMYFKEIRPEKHQRFLLCTDGVWESMSAAQMEKCVAAKELKDAAYCLFDRTMENGATDNLSFILLEKAG